MMYLREGNENKGEFSPDVTSGCAGLAAKKEIATVKKKKKKMMASPKEKAAIRIFVCEQLRAEPDLRYSAFTKKRKSLC